MPDDIRGRDENEDLDDLDEQERGIGESDEDFDDEDDSDEEDLDTPRGIPDDRSFTSEIGSEGGSQGDMEVERRKPRVMRGSEATTTAETDRRTSADDRHAGGGLNPRRR